MCHLYSRLVEQTIHANIGYYLSQHPDAQHLPIDAVITAFKDGFNEEGLLDSHLPGLSTVMMQLPNSREKWFAERLGIESISRDIGDPNIFLTLNMDCRSWFDTRQLLYKLENGTDMPRDHPFEVNTEKFTELMDKYAPQIAIYLCRKAKIFLRAFLGDICGIPEHEDDTDWTVGDRSEKGWWWGRVEYTESRGNYDKNAYN